MRNTMYKKILQFLLLYFSICECCEITKLKILQNLQNRGTRIVTSSPFDTLAAPLLLRFGWLTINTSVNQETYIMVYKSLNDLASKRLGNIVKKLSDILLGFFYHT